MKAAARRCAALLATLWWLGNAGCSDAEEPAGAGGVAAAAGTAGMAGTAGTGAERETSLGRVRGQRAGDTWVFRGIPFAAPPVGELRFRPPEPHPGWSGVLDAFDYGPKCAQLDGSGAFEGSEDCLTLNVWTPAPAGVELPVMVWMHGGDNMGGSASEPGFFGGLFYDGENLAQRGQVVVVTIQYRVGAFGFLPHPDFAADNSLGATGNWGLMDQIAALEWVRDNIHHFGGDASNVTLFGQSAGGDDTCALVASPRAAGLFQRAISMSPGGCHTNDASVSAQVSAAVTSALGCTGADAIGCLRALSADQLAHAPQSGSPLHPDRIDFYVSIDGWVMTERPLDVIRAGHHNPMPLVFGTTAEEYAAILFATLPETIPASDYPLYMDELFGPVIGPQAVGAYDPADYGGSIHVALIAALGDAVHHCSVRAVTRALASSQSEPVYRYVYGHAYADSRLAPYGAAHGFELPLVFGNPVGIELTSDELTLSNRMLDAFARFAHTADPDPVGSDDWPRYDAASDSYAIAEQPWATLSGFRAPQCDFWDGVWAN